MWLLFAGAATSQQAQVLNNQVNLNDVFVSQTLDVVDQTGAVQGVTASTANSHLAGGTGKRQPEHRYEGRRPNGPV